MRVNVRTIAMLGVGIAVVAGLVTAAFREQPVTVDLHEVTRGPMQITINADGKTKIQEVYDIAAPITGTTRRSPVEVGDQVVEAETVVAVVEPIAPSLLDTRSRREAEAAIQEAQAALHVAESELLQATEDLNYAQSQFDRVKKLVERGVSSFTQLEDVTQALAVRHAAHDAAASRVEMTDSALERARAALIEPTDPGQYGNGTCCVQITAPITGTVLSVDMVSESPVTAGTRLLSVGQRDDLEIVADLLSADAVRVAPGARAIVERWGGPRALEARLRSIEPSARTKVSALGIEEQRVDAIFDLISPPQQRPGLGDGFAVFLRIVEWEAEDVIQIPLSAVFRAGDNWATFVARDGTAQLIEISLGRRNGSFAEVLGGLDTGARVITHPSDDIADGTKLIDRGAL